MGWRVQRAQKRRACARPAAMGGTFEVSGGPRQGGVGVFLRWSSWHPRQRDRCLEAAFTLIHTGRGADVRARAGAVRWRGLAAVSVASSRWCLPSGRVAGRGMRWSRMRLRSRVVHMQWVQGVEGPNLLGLQVLRAEVGARGDSSADKALAHAHAHRSTERAECEHCPPRARGGICVGCALRRPPFGSELLEIGRSRGAQTRSRTVQGLSAQSGTCVTMRTQSAKGGPTSRQSPETRTRAQT